ncbi:hypothetical protein [uncultured Helicobacter sp.]|uniref:hypothetical protein n=1 Tax=uncultured Helicobacter sp. TaxID=175537 RepID=UPI00375294C8
MITRISALQKLLLKSDSKALHFNANLPVSLKVLQKLDMSTYLLQVGTKTLKTTSSKPLHIGQKYWAQMASTKDGNIVLNNLIERPKVLDFVSQSPLKFSPDTLQKALKDLHGEFSKEMAQFSTEQMAQAKDKSEFEYFGFVLMGLKHGVLNLCVFDRNSQDGLLQLTGSKHQITFCAIMPNLGIIKGIITLRDDALHLTLTTNFENTLRLLQSYAHKLEGFQSINFEKVAQLQPLFTQNTEHLLNITG